jgi:hypothetical protein
MAPGTRDHIHQRGEGREERREREEGRNTNSA